MTPDEQWAYAGPPQAAGFPQGASLPTIGRAARSSSIDDVEVWRLDRDDASAAARIVALGRQGIGGLVAAGSDADGPWFVRRIAGQATVHACLRDHGEAPMAWSQAVALAIAIAGRLCDVEAACLLPGPLAPKEILIGPPVVLTADALLASLVGESGVRMDAGSSALSRWVAPAQAAGAPWDAAANRYVLGLLLYRMLAGQHPFSGQGLRRRLDTQALAGAPPMPDPVAHTLPPGLQALTMRMLAADPDDRPSSARALAHELASFATSSSSVARPRGSASAEPLPPVVVTDSSPSPTASVERADVVRQTAGAPPAAPRPVLWQRLGAAPWRRLAAPVAIVLGLGLGAALTAAVQAPASPSTDLGITIAPRPPLSAAKTRPDDCGTCHPEQTAQWHLSVMAHAAKSPLFQGLEILIEEQVGKRFDCPDGAGILRRVDAATACRDPDTGLAVTGSGGQHWCVNCHTPGNNLNATVPAWDGISPRSASRRPLTDIMPDASMDGISCAFCHQVHGPVQPGAERRGGYEGNPDWISTQTGRRFSTRPEDLQGRFGIGNSGYDLDPSEFLAGVLGVGSGARLVPGGAHRRPTDAARDYLASSEFCGACHDVRLFGTDVLGAAKGEHFKRLRNAYSEWEQWAQDERRAGKDPASCQDCHMSAFPGICAPGAEPAPPRSASALRRACPKGTHFEAVAPATPARGMAATASGAITDLATHYFTGVDVPLSDVFPLALIDDDGLDPAAIPRGAQQRRDLLLGRTFRFSIDETRRRGSQLSVPVVIENIGAGHRVPAGFSQEREFWVHLRVTDASGRVLYEVGRVESGSEDLRDKVFVRVNVDDGFVDDQGRPLGVFGADVIDGPDVPRWRPLGGRDGTEFSGLGLINLQNGFLRCVTCIGFVDARGECQPGLGQGRTRADRFEDGVVDNDTGECTSNLVGEAALLETYFPIGALDATRGVTKGPDAIIDRRSAAPGVPLRYTYELGVAAARGPLTVEARLLFRAFPPFLIKAFADYESRQAARGKRPSGPLVTRAMLDRLEVVELHRITLEVP
ncbi:MAG: hypothetical protein JKY37_05775 [Nannocystaceae bacterium]|nr:hypothetical protein [Nannocystaceae bacterium]